MRNLIIIKIKEIKEKSNNFNKNIMRWKNLTFRNERISEVNFEYIDDASLLEFYNLIYRQLCKQM